VDIPIPHTHEELVLRGRYETLSTVNDLLIAVWFLIGSILFFQESTAYAGTWLFVIGSAQLMIRPIIRLSRRVHLQRVRAAHDLAATSTESDDDF
jgi:hypothetical protein